MVNRTIFYIPKSYSTILVLLCDSYLQIKLSDLE